MRTLYDHIVRFFHSRDWIIQLNVTFSNTMCLFIQREYYAYMSQ